MRLFRFRRGANFFGRKAQPHPCASSAVGDFRSVKQLHSSAVLLKNAPDDRETKARALFARCYVGLKQPITIFLRQAGAVVDHVNHDLMTFALYGDANPSTSEFFGR